MSLGEKDMAIASIAICLVCIFSPEKIAMAFLAMVMWIIVLQLIKSYIK